MHRLPTDSLPMIKPILILFITNNTRNIMSLKSFDFFKRLQTEESLKSSTGGFFTIASFCLAVFLVVLSIQQFTHVQYETSLVIRNDPNEYLPLLIDIYFNAAPCQLLVLEFSDELQYVEKGLEKQLMKTVVGMAGEETSYVEPKNDEEIISRVQEAMDKGHGCRMKGSLNLPKTPGSLTFQTTGRSHIAFKLSEKARENIRASYRLNSLQFGESPKALEFPVTHYSQGIKKYIQELQSDIYSRQVIQDFTKDTQNMNYYSHLKIIPIEVNNSDSNSSGEEINRYRFSIRSGKVKSSSYFGSNLVLMTEIQPIHILYTTSQMSVYELSVAILAIVGGSVATVGTLNMLSHQLFGIQGNN